MRAADAFLRRHVGVVSGLIASVLLVALVWVASLPTGADSAAATVGQGSRLAASVPVADVEVLVVARGGALSVHVAYPSEKGWLSIRLPAAPSTAVAAWAATGGSDVIPPLSVVYGRAAGSTAVIRWADGEETTVEPAADGVYVAVRDRRVASEAVHVLGPDGVPVLEVDGP